MKYRIIKKNSIYTFWYSQVLISILGIKFWKTISWHIDGSYSQLFCEEDIVNHRNEANYKLKIIKTYEE